MTNDTYLVKLKSLSTPDPVIAQKLGMTVEEVERKWKQLQDQAAAMQKNGYQSLLDLFTILCSQYQLLGESLKIVAGALGNEVGRDELERMIVADPKVTMANLEKFIVLQPFTPIAPEESLKRTLAGN